MYYFLEHSMAALDKFYRLFMVTGGQGNDQTTALE